MSGGHYGARMSPPTGWTPCWSDKRQTGECNTRTSDPIGLCDKHCQEIIGRPALPAKKLTVMATA